MVQAKAVLLTKTSLLPTQAQGRQPTGIIVRSW
jgi:hypothetical protein